MSELSIKNVHHVKSHILGIEFSDGHKQNVGFAPFILSSGHPGYDKYRKESEFLKAGSIPKQVEQAGEKLGYLSRVCNISATSPP